MNLPITGTAPPFPSSVLTAAWVYSSALSSFAGLRHGVPPDLPPAVPLQHQVQQAAFGLHLEDMLGGAVGVVNGYDYDPMAIHPLYWNCTLGASGSLFWGAGCPSDLVGTSCSWNSQSRPTTR